MSSNTNKFHFRLVLLGSNETGKTSILNRFLFKKFETKYKPTVEDLFSKEFDLGSIEIEVDFLDTSGSMQFPAMRRLSITTGDAFLIVYALDDENSYEVVKLCMAEIQEIRPDFQKIPIVFAGNKSDLPREARKVPKEVVSNYVHYELPRLQAKVIECSCKDDVNVDSIFRAYLSLARVSLSTSAIINNSGSNSNNKSQSIRGSSSNNFSFSGSIKRASSALPGVIGGGGGGGSGDTSDSRTSSRCESPREQTDEDRDSSCGTSIKLALGVRKSCDASIVSSMRKVSLSANGSRNSRDQLLESMSECDRDEQQQQQQHIEQQQPKTSNNGHNINNYHDNNNNNSGGNNHNINRDSQRTQLAPKLSIESILMDAIQKQQQQHPQQQLNSSSKLSVNSYSSSGSSRSKPRSRSLIWRPHSKSSRSTANNSSDCRVT